MEEIDKAKINWIVELELLAVWASHSTHIVEPTAFVLS